MRRLPAGRLEPAPVLAQSRWFRELAPGLQAALLARGQVCEVAAGCRIFSPGDRAGALYCVLEGAVRLGVADGGSGTENLFAVIQPVSWFAEMFLFDAAVQKYAAVADADSRIFLVPGELLAAVLAESPELWRELARLLVGKLRLLLQGFEAMGSLPAAGRLARRLVAMASNYENWKDRRSESLQVSQEDLASMSYLSRQTTNLFLREFERDGLIALQYGRIQILDMAGLVARAEVEGDA